MFHWKPKIMGLNENSKDIVLEKRRKGWEKKVKEKEWRIKKNNWRNGQLSQENLSNLSKTTFQGE
jgi:hypothetical protein